MLVEELMQTYLKQLAAKAQMGYLAKKGWHQKILVRCRKVRICPHCNAPNGQFVQYLCFVVSFSLLLF